MPTPPRKPSTSHPQPSNRPSLPPRTHLIISYGVALLIFPVGVIWRTDPQGSIMGTGWFPLPTLLPISLWVFHFLRRTAESAWLHRFGRDDIPLSDAVTVYLYYWGFALWISFSVSGPDYTLSALPTLFTGLALFIIGETGNLR